MDEPLRGGLRPARRRGLTSPDPRSPRPCGPPRPPGTPPASIPGPDQWTSRAKVGGRKATPASTIKITSVGSARQNAVIEIRAVD